MKKIIFILCLLYPINLFAVGTCWNGGSSGTNPWTVLDGSGGAASAEYADVNYCINTIATEGDTVIVGEDTATWASTITINKSITIQGQTTCTGSGETLSCADSTVINQGSRIFNISVSGDKSIDISGITIEGNESTTGMITITNSSLDSPLYNVRIHHNEFRNGNGTGSGGAILYINNYVFGLIDHNKFTSNKEEFYASGQDANSWTTYPGYTGNVINSGRDYIYFEDNSITENNYIVNDTGTGSRWVVRHNYITASGSGCLDAHGDTRNRGVVAFEVYENTVVRTGSNRFLDYRGGTGIIFNNNIDGPTATNEGYIQIREENELCNACSAGSPNCLASLCDPVTELDAVYNGYIWNNIRAMGGQVQLIESDTYSNIAENTNWYDDGSSAGGAETSSNFITGTSLPGTCTVNDSYYDTDAEHGANYSTGELYRCTETDTWTWVYSPYIYPHPLQVSVVEAPSGTVVPGIIYEVDIKTGQVVITVTISDDTFVTLDNTIKAAIVAGLDSTSISDTDFSSLIESDPGTWSAGDNSPAGEGSVTLLSSTQLQIITPTAANYSLPGGTNETITVNLPTSSQTSNKALNAGTFTIYGQTEGPNNGFGTIVGTSGGATAIGSSSGMLAK